MVKMINRNEKIFNSILFLIINHILGLYAVKLPFDKKVYYLPLLKRGKFIALLKY